MELGLNVEMELSGRAFAICYYVEPGGVWWTSVLNPALPPQRHRPDTWPEHQLGRFFITTFMFSLLIRNAVLILNIFCGSNAEVSSVSLFHSFFLSYAITVIVILVCFGIL